MASYYPSNCTMAMPNKVNEEVIEMACLGRPFQMGMLYDARRDTLIPGVSLWAEQKLMSALKPIIPRIQSDFEVIAEDGLDSKASHLDVSASLKLSFLGGMVDVSGSAKYLDDRKSSKQQSRVSLKYWSATKFEQLSMDQLAKHIEYPEVFENKTATHVVTGILYGADSIFVFDRNVEEGESECEVHEMMKVLIKSLPEITDKAELNINNEKKKESNKLTCKFYGDLTLKKNPTTFADAVAIYQQLPELLVGDDGPIDVPKKVWLYPLSKLNSEAAKLVHEISVGFVHQAQAITEELLDLNMQSNDLLKTKVCSHFFGIQTQLSKFKEMVSEYKTTFSKELKQILPAIREGHPESKLVDLFQSKDRSPFNSHDLTHWLKDKEQEIKVLGAYLKMMQEIESALSPGDLSASIFTHDRVLCFSLKVATSANDYLDKMQAYLRSHDPGQTLIDSISQPWFKNKEMMAIMRQKAKRFVTFAKANKENSDIRCLVADSSEDGFGFSCAIVLYDNGRALEREFEPPSAPSKVKVSSSGITHSSVRLEWSKPEYGSENVKFYTVSYLQENDSTDSWHSMRTKGNDTFLTIDNLQERKGYHFKVRAESEIGYSQYSENGDLIRTASNKGIYYSCLTDELLFCIYSSIYL